ncbi:MAG: TIGR00266 family protein [Candidatus Sumerlaeia bacterium]|nr:TIGR00266 family protein [Candidatus Sumerlaeia bacterium]
MQHEILYQPSYSLLVVTLEQGERIMAEAGAMVSMSPVIKLDAQVSGGGLFGAVKSMAGGESIFRSTYTAEGGRGEVTFAPGSTGDIMAIELRGEKMMVQSGSYLAGAADFQIGVQGSLKAMISGESLFLLTVQGSGTLFVSSFGAIHALSLDAGEEYLVDTSHIVAFDSTVTYSLEKATGQSQGVGGFFKGLVKSAMSGEGFVCRYRGPGRIYIQTRSFQSFINTILPFLPKRSN